VTMSEEEYWRTYHLIRGEVEAAIKSNHAYITINNLVVADRDVYERINRSPAFWQLNAYALQTTFFIVFGRLFDNRTDSHSIQKLVDITIANPALFSKEALRQRKRENSKIYGSDSDPGWLTEYLKHVWEPTMDDLRVLRTELEPHIAQFRTIYRPIRHKFYAHKSTESEAAIAALFGKTLIGDVNRILAFLYTLLWCINDLALNGHRPNLTDFRSYDHYVTGLNADTEKFIRSLQ
jgi:AbiU2